MPSVKATIRWCLAALAIVAAAPLHALHAQSLPTPDQAKRLLETRPELVAQLRREIANSGLTPDQIRSRLRAAGYPENFLDGYLGGTRPQGGGRDSLNTPAVTEGVLDAVAALGLVDSVDTSELRDMIRKRSGRGLAGARGERDSTTRRGLRAPRGIDSLALADSVDSLTVVDTLGRLVRVPHRIFSTRARSAERDTGTTIFGLSVFANTTTQFDPNLAAAVDPTYRLGPGDRLVVFLTGDAERALTLDVTREGFAIIPGVGQVPVANLTLSQVEDLLYVRLGKVYSGLKRGADATTHFSLNLARIHNNQVYVLGDVDQPSAYRIPSVGTALTALYAAGGPTENGSMRRIEIRRGGKLMDSLDLYDYLLRADASHDPRLQAGDVVFVPVHGPRVRVYGEVTRPGTYEMRRGESLADLLQAAGGFTADAQRQRLQVERILPPNERDTTQRARVVIDVTSTQPNPEAAPAFPLEAGDVVRVFRVPDRVGRRVTVRGNVGTPGVVGYTSGMRLSEALRAAGGIKPDSYLGQVLVARLRGADSSRVQVRAMLQDSTGRPVDDILLREDDEIRVFSVSEFRTPEYVAINGAVHRPGRYAYRDGMTLRDLVLLAGGLEDRASVRQAEIARLPKTRDGSRLAVSQRVALDSSYLFASHNASAPGGAAARVVQAGATRDVTLEAYDNVLIIPEMDWAQPRHAVVIGEVRSPGSYALLTKTDRLSDLIQRAGGLTPAAYPGGIVFYRQQGQLGRVGVDLAAALRDTNSRENMLLVDGDSIFLPAFNGLIEVQGSVNAPRGVAWVPGAKLDYYVRAAGGPSRVGDLSHAYVTQPDGSVETVHARTLLPDSYPEPRPGSVIFVTQRDQQDHVDPVARLGAIAQVLSALVTLVVLSRR